MYELLFEWHKKFMQTEKPASDAIHGSTIKRNFKSTISRWGERGYEEDICIIG